MNEDPEKGKYVFSFLMVCYKQEKYIARAMESALAQTIPIELVVSDDHSPDRTFEIASEIASRYHGPHRIILNRNPDNLGVGANFCRAAELAHGEWLFMAAGDDLSLPDRAEKIRKAIQKYPEALAFGASRILIDAEERVLGYEDWSRTIHGASAVWHRSCFTRFPAIPPKINIEDTILYYRVLLLNGQAVVLNEPMVQYRCDGLSHWGDGEDYKTYLPHSIMLHEVAEKALAVRSSDDHLPGLPLPEETLQGLRQCQEEHLRRMQRKLNRLRRRNSCLQLGFPLFLKKYLTGTLGFSISLKEMLKTSVLFFKRHPGLYRPSAVLPDREDIVITVERYLSEPGCWDS